MFYLGADAIVHQRHLLEKLGKLARVHTVVELLLALLQISLQLQVDFLGSDATLTECLQVHLSLVEVKQHLVERDVTLVDTASLDNPDELTSGGYDFVSALKHSLEQIFRRKQTLNRTSRECTVKG